jgi:pimeloyl-ACP methyl ester carboxylesterase
MSVFALIHGSMHGAWCWRDLVPELERLGHRAVVMDLPCEDASAGLAEYADTIEAAVGEASDVFLVGHSLGGRSLPVVASRRPVSRMIFLCCTPTPLDAIDSTAFAEMVTEEYASARFEERADGTRRMAPESAIGAFFHDCPPETARWAAESLRWQGPKPLSIPSPVKRWPETPMDIVLTRDDRAVRFDWALGEARRWLESREPVVLPGSHSPFLSRPAELAEVLARIAG